MRDAPQSVRLFLNLSIGALEKCWNLFKSKEKLRMKKSFSRVRVTVAALVSGVILFGATATSSAAGTTSLGSVLTSDGNQFDKNGKDFDILTEAVLAVLANNPESPLKAVLDGSVALTVFAPTDAAFRALVKDLTGRNIGGEKKVFDAVAGYGLGFVEDVLIYHVVSVTITAKDALKANGKNLKDPKGRPFLVSVKGGKIRLSDANPSLKDPMVIAGDINEGNLQIAHAIDRVLIPVREIKF